VTRLRHRPQRREVQQDRGYVPHPGDPPPDLHHPIFEGYQSDLRRGHTIMLTFSEPITQPMPRSSGGLSSLPNVSRRVVGAWYFYLSTSLAACTSLLSLDTTFVCFVVPLPFPSSVRSAALWTGWRAVQGRCTGPQPDPYLRDRSARSAYLRVASTTTPRRRST